MLATSERTTFIGRTLGSDLQNKVSSSRVLMVGAGGIGCELLKNLVLSGFGEIHVVDLDTIDLSNLNRQFLFQRQHISKSKAHVARETALQFNPDAKVFSYHANIKESQFDVEWFAGFALVLNALDNIDARRYVNKMCLAANVPLVESGTAGYNGQVSVISKGKSACYDCQTLPTPKTYAVCTIRSTPSLPIHCIVWAKDYLFAQIFGPAGEDEDFSRADLGSDNADEIENLRREAAATKELRSSVGSGTFPAELFEKIFVADVEKLLEMKDLWKTRTPPTPLDGTETSHPSKKRKLDESSHHASSGAAPSTKAAKDQSVGSTAEYKSSFLKSAAKLCKRIVAERKADPDASLSFDKDDEDVMDFVAATANLRAAVYGIPLLSRFKIKEMAGNIIPAVATTNAIVAGFVVLEAFKVIAGKLESCALVYTKNKRTVTDPDAFSRAMLSEPNPDCAVCQNGFCILRVNTSSTTLNSLVEDVLRDDSEGLALQGEITVEDASRLLYDPDTDDDVLEKTLAEMGVKHGSVLDVRVDNDDENGIMSFFLFVLDRDESTFELVQRPELKPRRVRQQAPEEAEPPKEAEQARKMNLHEEGTTVVIED